MVFFTGSRLRTGVIHHHTHTTGCGQSMRSIVTFPAGQETKGGQEDTHTHTHTLQYLYCLIPHRSGEKRFNQFSSSVLLLLVFLSSLLFPVPPRLYLTVSLTKRLQSRFFTLTSQHLLCVFDSNLITAAGRLRQHLLSCRRRLRHTGVCVCVCVCVNACVGVCVCETKQS